MNPKKINIVNKNNKIFTDANKIFFETSKYKFSNFSLLIDLLSIEGNFFIFINKLIIMSLILSILIISIKNITIRVNMEYLITSVFHLFFFDLKYLFKGNHNIPNIKEKIAIIIPIMDAIRPPPIPGPI